MFRDLLSSKLVIAGLTCCVLLVAGSLLYRSHVVSGIRKDEARTQQFLQQLESSDRLSAPQQQEATTDAPEGHATTPVATDDAAESMPDISVPRPNSKAAHVDTAEAPEATVAGEKTTDVPVSPYGFGPYPELPEGWPADQIWPCISANHELMMRVEIKLAHQGLDVMGSIMENGLVYPTISDTVYIEWAKNARRQYIRGMAGDPDACDRIRAIEDERGIRFTAADIPSDIKVLSFQEDGIDPYEFLDLPSH